jgi:sugar phosphate isomerase/epimerase
MKFAAHLWDRGNLAEMLMENSFDGVDFVETSWRYFLANDEAGIERLGGMLRERDVSISAVHAPFGPEDDLSNPDESARKATLERHGMLMERIAPLGVTRMIIHPSPPIEERDAAARESCVLDSLGVLVKEAGKRGVRLALENMPPRHLGDESGCLRRIVEKVGSRRLGVCFDTGHAHITEEGVKNAFDTLKDLTIAFHIHDNDSTRDMHIPPPYGTIDWIGFSKQLGMIEIRDPLTIEARPWAGRDRGAMIEEVKAVLAGRQTSVCPACGHLSSVPVPTP